MSTTGGHDPLGPVLARCRAARPVRLVSQVIAVVAAVAELAVPVIIAVVVARLLDGQADVARAWVPLLPAVLLAGTLAALQVVALTRVAAAEMHALRLAVAERLIALRPRTVERIGVEEAMSVYSHYVQELEPFLTADRVRRRTSALTVAGCLLLMVLFEWRLTLALLAALAVTGLVIVIVLRPVKERASAGLAALALTTGDLGEYLRSIRSATVYGLRSEYVRRFDHQLAQVASTERQVGRAQAMVDLVVKATSMLLLVALGGLGALLVSAGEASLSNVAGFLGALAILLAPAARYAELLQKLQFARAAESRLREILTSTPLAEAARTGLGPSRVTSVRAHDVVISPVPELSVGPVSFTAHTGDLVCLVGESGAGKTTLLSAVAGFIEPDAGRIEVSGRDLIAWPRPELWRSISYVEQASATLGTTIGAFLRVDGHQGASDETLTRLISALGLDARLTAEGLDTPLERSGTSLSGGERQRLANVRALATDRPLLLLDEPTAHLDKESEVAFLDLLDDVRRDRIVIAATHSESIIGRADHIIRLTPRRLPTEHPTQPGSESAQEAQVSRRSQPQVAEDLIRDPAGFQHGDVRALSVQAR